MTWSDSLLHFSLQQLWPVITVLEIPGYSRTQQQHQAHHPHIDQLNLFQC